MIHFIIILHFLCISAGLMCALLGCYLYVKKRTAVLRDVCITEFLVLVLFLVDSVAVYIRTVIAENYAKSLLAGIGYGITIVTIVFLCRILRYAIKQKLYKRMGISVKVTEVLLILTCIVFITSNYISVLQGFPYLCVLYLLQSMLVLLGFRKFSELSKQMEDKKAESDIIEGLTDRENEVVQYISRGLSNKEIADTMFISANTVKNHISNIYRKTNVKNKVELLNLLRKQTD